MAFNSANFSFIQAGGYLTALGQNNHTTKIWKYLFLAVIFALAGGVIANAQSQGQPDPAFMTKAIQTLQQQRNNAQDQLAAEQARRMMLEEEVTKLKADAEAAKKDTAK